MSDRFNCKQTRFVIIVLQQRRKQLYSLPTLQPTQCDDGTATQLYVIAVQILLKFRECFVRSALPDNFEQVLNDFRIRF